MTRLVRLLLVVAIVAASLGAIGCESAQAKADREAKAAIAHDRTLAADSLKSLDRIKSDLDVGINFFDFGRRLQDANYALESFKPSTAQGAAAKSEMTTAVLYYKAAREAWNWANQGDVWPADGETAVHWANDYPEVVQARPEITAPYPEIARGQTPDFLDTKPAQATPTVVRETSWAIAQQHVEAAKKHLAASD